LTIKEELKQAVRLDVKNWRGKSAADKYAQNTIDRIYLQFMRFMSPLLFGCLLSFDLYGFNQGMFYTFDKMSADQLRTCRIGITLNFAVSIVSLMISGYVCRHWLAINPSGDAILVGDNGVDVDLARFTVICALDTVKQQTVDCLFDFFALLWMTCAAVTTVVGVCMVMKHDGMDIDGWAKFLFEDRMLPYPLCPLWAAVCERVWP